LAAAAATQRRGEGTAPVVARWPGGAAVRLHRMVAEERSRWVGAWLLSAGLGGRCCRAARQEEGCKTARRARKQKMLSPRPLNDRQRAPASECVRVPTHYQHSGGSSGGNSGGGSASQQNRLQPWRGQRYRPRS
jgi:hypothetical protein